MRLIRPLLLAIITVAGSYTAALIVAAITTKVQLNLF